MILILLLTPATVRLPDGTIFRHRTPILEACRRLVAAGTDPKARFEAWWEGASYPALLGTFGGAAKLDVREDDRVWPRFVPYRRHPLANMPRAVARESPGRAKATCPLPP